MGIGGKVTLDLDVPSPSSAQAGYFYSCRQQRSVKYRVAKNAL